MAHHQPTRKHAHPPRANVLASAVSDIPDKLYFRIGEVARLCDVPAYVLRFWESEFPQLKPNKGGTGQRLFRRRDVETALRIKRLLYDEGYTIPGARQLLKSEARLKEPQLLLLGEETNRSSRPCSRPRVASASSAAGSICSARPAASGTRASPRGSSISTGRPARRPAAYALSPAGDLPWSPCRQTKSSLTFRAVPPPRLDRQPALKDPHDE